MTADGRLWLLALAFAALALFAPACDEAETVDDDGILVPRDDQALAFGNPSDCAECHQQHVDEWSISNHAYALKDPVFNAMLTAGQKASEGKLGQFCVQCHTPVGLAAGQTPITQDPDSGVFSQPLDKLDPIAEHGVSCDVCHSMTDVIEPVNARSVMTPDGVRRSTIKDPAANDSHESAYSELHEKSDMCGTCHAVINPKQARVEETFPEWQKSQAAAEGKTCQTCHMPSYEGVAAKDGPTRTVHRHTFVGVDVSLLDPAEFPGFDEMRELTAELLRSSAALTIRPDGPGFAVDVTNLAGHALPSGATAERQMWLDITVRDAADEIVFRSGDLDAQGDLKVGNGDQTLEPFTDPQLAYFGQQLIDVPGLHLISDEAERADVIEAANAACLPMSAGAVMADSGIVPVSFPWQANWQCNYMIQPDETATASYDLSSLPAGSYQVEAALKFRTFPPYFLRKLEAESGLDAAVKTRVPIVTMATVALDLSLDGGG